MADPQTADQGFLAGLLGKFGADPAAAYGGLLSDPATQRQFALRSLGAAAQAMAQASMPVPYKGGTPWGSFLGSAGGAASTAGDELIKARLEQAQAQLASQQGLLSQAKVQSMQNDAALYPIALGMEKSVPGTGTGTDGKPLTGPAAIIAGKGGKAISSTTADTSLPPEARALLDTIAGPESNGAYNVRWGGPSGDKTFDSYAAHPNIPEPGPQGDSTAAGRYQIVNKTWKPLQAKYGFGDFTPVTQDQAGWHLAADTYKEQTGRDLLTDLQAGKTDQVASALHGQWSTLNMGSYGKNLGKYQGGSGASPQTASTGDQPAAAPGSQVGPYAPVPGQPGPQGVYVPPGASPNAPPVRIEGGPPAPAALPGGLLKLPDPTSAAPPQLLTPPAAGAPGPVTGLLGQQPAQQVAAADAPQLSPAAAAVLQGINKQQAGGGLLASGSVAGGNAVPTGGPSPAAVAQAGPPHTGAAGAAELAGLLAQQPPPQAPAAGPVPPAAAPAPAPATAGPMPPAPGGAPPPGVAPPMPPMIPSPPIAPAAPLGPIPGAPTDRQIAAASIIAHNYINRGEAVPPDIADILKFKYAGPTAAATAQATAPITQANQAQQAQVTARWNLWAEQNKPILARPNTLQINQNGQVYGQYEGLGDDGARHTYVMVPGPDGQAQKKDLGKTALTPEEEARQKATGGNVANLSPTNPMGAPAAATLPRVSPYGVIPPLSEQNLPASAKEAESAIPLWQTHVAEWTKGIQPAQQAEQRLLTIGQAFKSIQTGTWATEGADLAGALKAIGINLPANALTDPAAAQLALHENILTTLPLLKAATPRPSQTEFVTTSENREHPNVQPEANLQMLSEDIALMRQAQSLPAAYNISGWQNPLSFETAYLSRNKLAPLVDQVKQEIGPLKGMPGATPPPAGGRNSVWNPQTKRLEPAPR